MRFLPGVTRQGLYRGRLAPSPTGLLHLGHARTFWIAAERARAAEGNLLLRNDDLDRPRCRPEFVAAFQEDLAWLGLRWEAPMISQSERIGRYRAAFERLRAAGAVYPCTCSRKEIEAAARAPHESDEADEADEPIYPGTCRPALHGDRLFSPERSGSNSPAAEGDRPLPQGGQGDRLVSAAPAEGGHGDRLVWAGPADADVRAANWRFRVPDGETVRFDDGALGPQAAVAGRDFGDFVVWRKDDWPSYQLACAVDDAACGITEVVRGADLVKSTFRQLLLLRALRAPAPAYFHCALVRDASGQRLAKRHAALALRTLRAEGLSPAAVVAQF